MRLRSALLFPALGAPTGPLPPERADAPDSGVVWPCPTRRQTREQDRQARIRQNGANATPSTPKTSDNAWPGSPPHTATTRHRFSWAVQAGSVVPASLWRSRRTATGLAMGRIAVAASI